MFLTNFYRDVQVGWRRHIGHTKNTMMHAVLAALVISISACALKENIVRGYIRDSAKIEQLEVGSLKGEVEILLGSPQITGTFRTNEVYYYVTQIESKTSFLPPETVDQKVLALFFDDDDKIVRIADYGIKNGRVVDFSDNETPVVGEDIGLVKQFFLRMIKTNE